MKEGENGLMCIRFFWIYEWNFNRSYCICLYYSKNHDFILSELLKGRFHNHYFEFSNTTEYRQFKGSTPWEKYHSNNSRITANTNFVSVADKFVQILKTGVKEKEFSLLECCV